MDINLFVISIPSLPSSHFIGEDGPSQMALEDFAMFRSVATSTCFYPSDAVSTERAIELAAQTKGITFTRTTRPALPVIYSNDEKFEIGKGKVGSRYLFQTQSTVDCLFISLACI